MRDVAVGRAQRWERQKPKFVAVFGAESTELQHAAKLFALLELAWHDCYGEVTPPDAVIENVLLCSQGTLTGLIDAAQLAVTDARDLTLWATTVRASPGDRR
jgi:hypothetical protein